MATIVMLGIQSIASEQKSKKGEYGRLGGFISMRGDRMMHVDDWFQSNRSVRGVGVKKGTKQTQNSPAIIT